MFNITPPQDYKATIELQQMNSFSGEAVSQFSHYIKEAYNSFWFGEVSPTMKIQMLGTSALEVFTKSAQGQAFMKLIDPTHIELGIPEGYEIQWNADGSGTITCTHPIVEPEL